VVYLKFKMMKRVLLIAVLFIGAFFLFKKDIGNLFANGTSDKVADKNKKNEKKSSENAAYLPNVGVIKQWDLPPVLAEVSGIAYIDEDRFACIQDEAGTIYIYNKAQNKIETEIPFAGAGDYEGLTLAGSSAYVVRADGRLFEVSNYATAKKVVTEYKTSLTVQQNVEGLTLDKANNRLLLAIKGDEPGNKNYKGIYAFDLSTKTFNSEPVYKIDLTQTEGEGKKGKKAKVIMPSEIGIHPQTGDIYILDGPQARMLEMDRNGTIKIMYQLGKGFAQAEGITFSPQGAIFISNEGKKKPGNIIEIELN